VFPLFSSAIDYALTDLLPNTTLKARAELSREKEHRVNVERQLHECHTVYTEELKVLNLEVADFKKCETEMRREYHVVCGERDDLRERCRSMLGEIDSLNTRNQALAKEIDGLRGDSSSSRTRCADSEARLVSAEAALREARQEANAAELALAERTASLEATSAQLSDSGAHVNC
jgi:chromosome segregation ATPase